MWASTLWPFSSSTRNMAFGRGSTTVPSSTIASSLGLARTELLIAEVAGRSGPPHGARVDSRLDPGPKGDASAGTAEVQLGRWPSSSTLPRAARAGAPVTLAPAHVPVSDAEGAAPGPTRRPSGRGSTPPPRG